MEMLGVGMKSCLLLIGSLCSARPLRWSDKEAPL